MKRSFIAAVAALALCAWTGAARAAEPIVIKFSHVVAADTNKGKTAEYFKKIVEERSKGAVRVEVHHNSTLYKDKEELEALQTGVVDGQENPPNVVYPSKLYEAQKYMTLSDHGYHGYALITNAKFWAGLPGDVRMMLEGAVRDASDYFNNAAKKENDDGVEAIRRSGRTEIITLTPQERLAWKKAMVKVHDEMADRIGRPLIQSIYQETGFDPAKL